MMHLKNLADKFSNKPAGIIADTGETISFEELYDRSTKLSNAVLNKLPIGSKIACLQKNSLGYYIAQWACLESPFRLVNIDWHLNEKEIRHVMTDSNADGLISSSNLKYIAEQVADLTSLNIAIGEEFGKFKNPNITESNPVQTDLYGALIYYSSGSTGAPKGVTRELTPYSPGDPRNVFTMASLNYDMSEDSVLFAPGPFYHATASAFSLGAQSLGATAITTEKFDAEKTLEYIDRYKITHLVLVPTHMIRLLKLPEEVKKKYDLSSLRVIVHGAAPCPIEVKEKMIEWVGPIITEFYTNSEFIGYTSINSHEWLDHKGSVGKSLMGKGYIVDSQGNELKCGEIGYLVFDAPLSFNYTNSELNKSLFIFGDKVGVGDIGWIDDEGYIYLTDRANHMIISGGVNIYPQEAENVLSLHPAIKDIAIIGVPDSELGEVAKAIIELEPDYHGDDQLKTDIIYYCRQRISLYKCPRTVEFVESLPRTETGKLLKRKLKEVYWGNDSNRIIKHSIF